MLLTGRIFDAAEALRIGLLNEIVPPEKLMDRARGLAAQLMENSRLSLAYTKRLLDRSRPRAELDAQIEGAIRGKRRHAREPPTSARASRHFWRSANRSGRANERPDDIEIP